MGEDRSRTVAKAWSFLADFQWVVFVSHKWCNRTSNIVKFRYSSCGFISLECRRGKMGGSGWVQVGSIGFSGRGSKHVIFIQVNQVTG